MAYALLACIVFWFTLARIAPSVAAAIFLGLIGALVVLAALPYPPPSDKRRR